MRILYLIFVSYCILSNTLHAQSPDWSTDIAPIIYKNCSSCHHEGGIAPFNLMSYDETVMWGGDIYHAVDERSMPPWPADPNYRHFVGETYLEDWQIEAVQDWILNGFPYGNADLEPDPPVFLPNGSLLESIDFTVEIEPYTLQSNFDEYRWFVIENPFDEPIYISKLEVQVGLEQIVHHADLFYDLSGTSLAFDQADPLPGFNGNTGFPNNDYYINAWQPGANVAVYPPDWGIKVEPEADFVIEIHYGPGGQGQVDDTKMNLQLLTNPENVRPVRAAWLLHDSAPVLTDGPLVIPANEVVTFHQQSAPLPSDLSLISICPHMHFLGKSYKVWAETPTNEIIPLIDIPQWDFHWQKYYTFQHVQKIPAGSVLKSEGVYDNTEDNHDNPTSPPITVSRGLSTEDEMFLCYFIYANYESGDEDILMDSTLLITNTIEPISENNIDFNIYPNPVVDELFLEGTSLNNQLNFRIIDVNARVVLEKREKSNDIFWNKKFEISHLKSGTYFLEWDDGINRYAKEFVKL